MPDNSPQIKALEEELKTGVLPTPRIGETIIWFPENKTADQLGVSLARAAIVTAVEGPGRLSVLVFAPNSEPRHRKGVWHTTWPGHQKPGNETTKTNGSWDYVDRKTPAKDRDLHSDAIKAKIAKYRETHVEPAGVLTGAK